MEKKLCGWGQKIREKWLGGSLRIWDWEGKFTICSAGLGFGRKIMDWEQKRRKMVRWENDILRLRGKLGTNRLCLAGLGFGRKWR